MDHQGLKRRGQKEQAEAARPPSLPLSIQAAQIFPPSLALSVVICLIDVKETTTFQTPPWSLLVARAPHLGFLR